MRTQLTTEKITNYPTGRNGYFEYKDNRVTAGTIDEIFLDAEDRMKQIIRVNAYQLWDRAGRPQGRSDEFWFAAHAGFEHEAIKELARFRAHQLTRDFEDL